MSNLSIDRSSVEVGRKMIQTSAGVKLGWVQGVILNGVVPILVGEDASGIAYAAIVGCEDTKVRLYPEDSESVVDAFLRELNRRPDVVLSLLMAGEVGNRPSERDKKLFLGGSEDDEPGVMDHDPAVVAAIMTEIHRR